MTVAIERVVAQLRAFVEAQGGRVTPTTLAQFYLQHPHAREHFQPTARVFVETHGHTHHLVWEYDRPTNQSAIVAEPRPRHPTATTASTPVDVPRDAFQMVQRLHAYLLSCGGSLAAGSLQQFYNVKPTSRRVMQPSAKAFITTYGDQVPGIQVNWIQSGGLTWIEASTTAAPAVAAPTRNQQTKREPWRECLELLDEYVRRREDCHVNFGLLGTFCKQNPSVANILRPDKSIRSCQAFVDEYGQREGFNLVWQEYPTAGVCILDSSISSDSDEETCQYIQISTVAEATAVVRTKLQHSDVMAIDLEGDLSADGQFSLLQVAVRSSVVYIFDILMCPAILSNASVGLRKLLESPSVVKVIHDGRHDFEALQGQFKITLVHVFDMQVAYCRLRATHRLVGINVVLEAYSGHVNTQKEHVKHRFGQFNQRPLPPKLLDYAAQDAEFTIQAYDNMSAAMDTKELRRCMQESIDRMKLAALESLKSSVKAPQLPTLIKPPTTTTPAKPAPEQRLSSLVRQQVPVSASDEEKYGIVVVDKDPDAFRHTIDEKVLVKKTYTIQNSGPQEIILYRVALVASSNAKPFSLPTPLKASHTLLPGQQFDFSVHFCSAEPGAFRAILTFKLISQVGHTIDVVRLLDNVTCVSATTPEALREMIQDAAINSRRYRRRRERTRPGKVVDTYVHNHDFAVEIVVPLAGYKMPKELETPGKTPPRILESTYVNHFQHMLWLEERQQQIEQHDYDMVGAVLQPTGRTYRLAVPGLAESRPSVLGGDKVFLVFKGKTYLARAVDVTRDDVVLGTPQSFSKVYQHNDRVDVRFDLSRMPMRLCHQGVRAFNPSEHRKFLFPTAPSHKIPPVSGRLQMKWTQALNPEQTQAVVDLQNFAQLTAPYIIFGPPGTGKTTTLVEAITQIAWVNPSCQMLLCAATNAAADLLVDRLSRFIAKGRMLRVMGAMRKERDTLASVLPFTLQDGNGGFNVASIEDLTRGSLQIVVATLGTGAKLYNYGITRSHFDIMAIDEAGQATEAEVMSVLGPLAQFSTALILAGDPQQLGPVIKSSAASDGGFGISLLERLVGLPVYQDTSPVRMITKLRRNYRAHPALLTVPSTLFYDSSLIACASALTCRGFEYWARLPQQGVPLIFHGVQGTDCQDSNSPSWFNPQEIVAVDGYVKSLLSNTVGLARRVAPTDIGIITPYAKQRQKIHQVLKASGIEGVRVGSVEQFQGAELPVIIVTTVRSSRDFFDEDAKFSLGFLDNAKRFNVAITRAQALLIVVGNPFVLSTDPNWKALLQYCHAQGAWKGAGKPEELEEAVTRADVIDHKDEDKCTLM